jgi:hypothetical protein
VARTQGAAFAGGKGKSEDAATGGEVSPVPRRTYATFSAALLLGLLSAFGVAACGSSSQSASTLETPPLTVDTGATLPDASAGTASTTTTTTTTTTDTSGGATATDTGGTAATGGDTGGTTGTGGDTGGTTAGGGATSTGGGGTTTTTPPANSGGANYQSFCDQNPGAC